MSSANHGRHRVVVVGGGFGGLLATRFLARAPVEVTLIDRSGHYVFQPLLYQVATGILSQGDVAPPLRSILRFRNNVRIELAEARGFDLEARTVTTRRPDSEEMTIPYDSLIVGTGAGSAYFGHDEWRTLAPGMKTIDDALNLRRRIFGAFEMAETEEDPDKRRAWLTFAVVGGGPTGCEMAGQIGELSRRTLKGEFRTIDPTNATVLLFDGGKEVLANFGDRLSQKATKELGRQGVEVRTGTRVVGVDPTGIDIEGSEGRERVEARTVMWAAGVQASPLAGLLAEASGAECDRAGRVAVQPDCTLPGHPEVFAIGDMMSLDGLPGVAEVAMQQGVHAARTIRRRLAGKHEERPFHYRDMGSMAVIGRGRAVVSFKGIRLSGLAGFLVWLLVHLTFISGFRNRFRTLLSWTASFIGRGRAERTFTVHTVTGGVAYNSPPSVPQPAGPSDG